MNAGSEMSSYVLTSDSANQVNIFKSTLKGWAEDPSDLLLLAEDGGKIFTNSRFLSLHSPMLRGIFRDISTQTAMTVPVSSSCLENLILLITKGIAQTSDINPVMSAASALGFNISNVEVGWVGSTLGQQDNYEIQKMGYEVENRSRNTELSNEAVNRHSRINLDQRTVNPGEQAVRKSEVLEPLPNVSHTHEYQFMQNASCGETIVKTEIIEQAVKINTNNQFSCSECSKSYLSAEGLRRHKITHTAEDGKPFECLLCGKRFSRTDKLNLHMKKSHGDDKSEETKERFPCDQCEKTFARKETLKRHSRNIHHVMLGHLSFSNSDKF